MFACIPVPDRSICQMTGVKNTILSPATGAISRILHSITDGVQVNNWWFGQEKHLSHERGENLETFHLLILYDHMTMMGCSLLFARILARSWSHVMPIVIVRYMQLVWKLIYHYTNLLFLCRCSDPHPCRISLISSTTVSVFGLIL